MLKKCLQIALRSKRCINLVNREQVTSYSSYKRYENYAEKQRMPLPSRPLTFENQQLTNVVESTEEFKFVEKLIPSSIVPEPPKHDSYPTPSGWVPIDVEKASQLPYAVLRTRFHQFPMYPLEREGGSRKLVRIKNIDGDIWKFDKDLRKFLEKCYQEEMGRERKMYTSVNEVQRQVLVKGHYMLYISEFLKTCGF